MYVYLALVGLIIVLPWIIELALPKKFDKKTITLKISILMIFLLFVLRAPTVGKDIMAYKKMYDSMSAASWSNFDMYWVEWGYELLMMIFIKIFHANFQVFLTVIYAYVCYSYYKLIKEYSRDYTTSLLIYICFTFFSFDLSGIRNMIAIAICLNAYRVLNKSNKIIDFKFILMVIIAAQIHTSAYVFLIVLIVERLPLNSKTIMFYSIGVSIVFIMRKWIIRFIKYNIKDIAEASLAIGGNTIMYILFIIASLIVINLSDKKAKHRIRKMKALNIENANIEYVSGYIDMISPLKMVTIGLTILIFASTSGLTRLSMFFQFFIIILLPNSIARLDLHSRVLIKTGLYVFLVFYYWKYALSVNSLSFIPYRLFF